MSTFPGSGSHFLILFLLSTLSCLLPFDNSVKTLILAMFRPVLCVDEDNEAQIIMGGVLLGGM